MTLRVLDSDGSILHQVDSVLDRREFTRVYALALFLWMVPPETRDGLLANILSSADVSIDTLASLLKVKPQTVRGKLNTLKRFWDRAVAAGEGSFSMRSDMAASFEDDDEDDFFEGEDTVNDVLFPTKHKEGI